MMRRAIVSATVICLVALQPSFAGDDLEYQVKAAFLFNFLKFVEWPATPADVPWVIGILGKDPFGGALDRTIRGKSVNGHAVEVRHYARPNDVKDCQIVFVSRVDFERMGAPVQPGLLTVGESPAFLKSGGVINFYLEDNHVHFEIRPDTARLSGLHVSAQLLKLGRTL